MFNFISKSTHKAVVADLTAEIDSLARSLRDEQTRARTSGRMASEFLEERDAARIERDNARLALAAVENQVAKDRADAERYRSQRAKAKLNLRQYRSAALHEMN